MFACEGGLGNQLFIIAFAYKVVNELNISNYEIIIDDREYKKYKIRNFEVLKIINDKNIRMYDKKKDKSLFYEITRIIYHIIQKFLPNNIHMFKCLNRMGLLYSKRSAQGYIPQNKDNIYIYGYFQDENMVRFIKAYMKKKLRFPHIDKEIRDNEYKNIAVSIRWGKDYIKQGWPICGEDFYIGAIKEILNRKYINQKCRIIFFSDEIEQVKEKIIFKDAIYVENKTSIEQLNIMSHCDDFIISNSSFSWWGAYLGLKKDSIIIAPKFWYDKKSNTKDCLIYFEKMEIKDY